MKYIILLISVLAFSCKTEEPIVPKSKSTYLIYVKATDINGHVDKTNTLILKTQ